MNPKLIAIITFSFLYGFLELFNGIRQSKKGSIISSGDRKSIWIIIICITIGYFLAFKLASTHSGRIYHWNLLFTIGATIVLIGSVIRIISIRTLKRNFTYTVSHLEDHELIEAGIYKYIRHPGYLGQILIFLGTATSLSNWLSVLFMMIPVLTGFLYRITIEEKFLVKQFGQKYLDYKNRTWGLIPYIF